MADLRNLMTSLVDEIESSMTEENSTSESHRDMEVAKRINNYCVNLFSKFEDFNERKR